VIRVDNIEEIRPLINRVINLLVDGIPKGEEFIRLFFQTCTIIRREDLMCEFHQKTDFRIKMKGCSLCPTYIPFQNQKEKKKS